MTSALLKDEPLPRGWRWAQLGEVCTPSREAIEPSDASASELPCVGLENITSNSGQITLTSALQVSGLSFRFDSRHILYGKLRPYLNKVALPTFQGRCSTEIIPLLPTDGVDRDYLAWCLRLPSTVEFAMRSKTGSRMPRADMRELSHLPVSLPPLDEQRRIVARLNEQMAIADRARRAAERMVEAAHALPSAMLRAVLPDQGQHLPEGWRWVKVGDVCGIIRGVTFKKWQTQFTQADEYIPCLRAGNIAEALLTHADLLYVPMKIVSREQRLRRGDIVMCTSSGSPLVVGKTAALARDWEGTVGAFCAIIRPQSEPVGELLRYWFRSRAFTKWRDGQTRGANIQNLRTTEVSNFHLPLPPPDEQRRIVARLDEQMAAAEQTRRAAKAQAEAAAAIPPALLRDAFVAAVG